MAQPDNVRQTLIQQSQVHQEWQPLLLAALETVDDDYLHNLLVDESWLPGKLNLFAAFRRDLKHCDYILFGESPYPRQQSANGIAFYDAAVTDIWSEKGLSKGVNRATSLRNIMKTALLAQGLIQPLDDGRIPQPLIAEVDKNPLIQNIGQLFNAFQQQGFLLLNATPVLHPDNAPAKEARYWISFVNELLHQINQYKKSPPTLILWGKIAQQIEAMPAAKSYPKIGCEHPYNISFIQNEQMQQLFSQLQILNKD